MPVDETETFDEEVKRALQEGRSEDDLLAMILPLLGRDPREDEKIVEALVALAHPTAARVLGRLLESNRGRKLRKTIKRALYRLRSKGIFTEEILPPKGQPVFRAPEVEPAKGFAGAIDAFGNRVLMLVRPRARRSTLLMDGLVSDTKGLVDFHGFELTRKGVRNLIEEVQAENPFPLVEMEASYVAHLYTEAYELTVKAGKLLPEDYTPFKGEIEALRRKYDQPLVYAYLGVEEILKDERLLGRTEDLFKVDVFADWVIEADLIRPYAEAFLEAQESRIVLTKVQQQVRIEEIYRKALSEIYSGAQRSLYKRRLEEMAYFLFRLGKEQEARIALAVAMDLEKPPHPIQPNPFLYQLVVKSVLSMVAESYEERRKEPSLIVKP